MIKKIFLFLLIFVLGNMPLDILKHFVSIIKPEQFIAY